MYKCIKCNKEFQYESKYIIHKNRKKECNIKKIYNCNICKKEFKYESKLQEHEKTKKHINNITIHGNNNHNINSTNINSFNNIIQLTLNVNSFKNTDTTYLRKALIEEVGEFMYVETIAKKYISDIEKVKILFDGVIKILEHLHFNLGIEENHNFKILLIFPGIKKTVYEYLILEINSETNAIIWNALTYEEIIDRILNHLYLLNNKYKNDNYDRFVLYLRRHLIDNKEHANELKSYIQTKLGDMYINFNIKQKKASREIKDDIEEKVKEYITYRTHECKLTNGYKPDIINSNI
jgi:DNA-directed RNA polymerase subunit RPC12/RpoP